MHVTIEPPILYFGTPVVLISTANPDGTPNLAPMSSAWALGWTIMLGLGKAGQTFTNLNRTGECVINLPTEELWASVERLAPLTGRDPVPEYKLMYGGRYEPRKFEAAALEPIQSECVAAPRVAECPLQLEAVLRDVRDIEDEPAVACAEVRVVRVHADESLLHEPGMSRIDPSRWRPLIYNFRHYYGLGAELGRSFRERPAE